MAKFMQKRLAGDIELRFKGGESLLFSQLREQFLLAFGWRGLPANLQRTRLEKMHDEFFRVKNALDRVRQGESIESVARGIGVNVSTLGAWKLGESLPKIISPKQIQASINKRKKYISAVALENPKIGYIFGIQMSRHAGTYVGQRGGISIVTTLKAGTIGAEVKSALEQVFNPHIETKMSTRANTNAKHSVSETLRAHSVEIAAFLNEQTFFGSRIPYKFLRNKETRREFARALIDANAFPFERSRDNRKTPEKSIIFKTRNRELRDYLSKTIAGFGIECHPRSGPILSKKEKWELFKKGLLQEKGKRFELFIPTTAFKAFKKEIGFRDPAKAKTLDNLLNQNK